jgi:hypothetical protein
MRTGEILAVEAARPLAAPYARAAGAAGAVVLNGHLSPVTVIIVCYWTSTIHQVYFMLVLNIFGLYAVRGLSRLRRR